MLAPFGLELDVPEGMTAKLLPPSGVILDGPSSNARFAMYVVSSHEEAEVERVFLDEESRTGVRDRAPPWSMAVAGSSPRRSASPTSTVTRWGR